MRARTRHPLPYGMHTSTPSGLRFQHVSKRVVTALGPVDGERAGANSTIVLGDNDTLIIDTMMAPALIQEVKNEAEKLGGRPVRYVFNTHGDPDHLLGNGVFDQAEIIAHERVAQLLADPERRANYEQHLEGTGVTLRLPDTTFEHELRLHLGGISLNARYVGPAHSEADTVLWVPEEHTFIAADTVFSGLFPLVRTDLNNWLAALAYGMTLKPRVVIPGHGPIGGSALLKWQLGVLEKIREAVTELHRSGVPLEEAAASPVPEGLKLPLAGARWPGAVRGVYALLNGW